MRAKVELYFSVVPERVNILLLLLLLLLFYYVGFNIVLVYYSGFHNNVEARCFLCGNGGTSGHGQLLVHIVTC
jgi:hypothetical protein